MASLRPVTILYLDDKAFVERERRRKRFAELRSRHYEMKDAIKRGKELVQSESEQSDGENDN
jgi:hypothetical protein